uniref:Secreted protein n=1 Tax=Steinernema glaseri TaxID=37863 RepID=A0A1I8A754_9BILA
MGFVIISCYLLSSPHLLVVFLEIYTPLGDRCTCTIPVSTTYREGLRRPLSWFQSLRRSNLLVSWPENTAQLPACISPDTCRDVLLVTTASSQRDASRSPSHADLERRHYTIRSRPGSSGCKVWSLLARLPLLQTKNDFRGPARVRQRVRRGMMSERCPIAGQHSRNSKKKPGGGKGDDLSFLSRKRIPETECRTQRNSEQKVITFFADVILARCLR